MRIQHGYRGVGGSEITPVDTDRILSGIGGGGEYRGEGSRLGHSALDFPLGPDVYSMKGEAPKTLPSVGSLSRKPVSSVYNSLDTAS